MHYPLQVIQSTNNIVIAFAYESTSRTMHLDQVQGPPKPVKFKGTVAKIEWINPFRGEVGV